MPPRNEWLRKALLSIIVILAGGLALALGTLLKQDLPLLDPPGLWARLQVYLGRNVAETAPDTPFWELAPVYIQGDPELILADIRSACRQLGWRVIPTDGSDYRINVVVTSRWLQFKDDLRVQLSAAGAPNWRLDIHSAARLGRADFGANERHILDLLAALQRSGTALRMEP